MVAATLEHFRKRPSLGFFDCLMLEMTRRARHIPLARLIWAWVRSPARS